MIIQQKSIYIIYTGGTIGMQHSQQGYVPSQQGYLQQQLQQIPWLQRLEMPKFTLHEYQPLIDSSEMTPAIWQQMATDIQTHYSDYDGFIVIQGTDTMAFTASALSFMLKHLAKPVIVTGSQIPLSELRSDGQSNLVNALYLAAHYPINEVTLFFDQKLFRGNRVTKVHAEGFSAFTSPNFPPLLETSIHIRQLNLSQSLTPSGALQIQEIHPQPIAIITLYPGLELNLLHSLSSQPTKAVILRTYGVGNAPRNPSFLLALEQIIAQKIPVINLTQCLSGGVNMQGYATGQSLASLGVISGADMTLEATVTKLHYLLSQSLTLPQLSQAMSANLRGELTPDGENSDWEAVDQSRQQLGGAGGWF